jgi:hypothetical protein
MQCAGSSSASTPGPHESDGQFLSRLDRRLLPSEVSPERSSVVHAAKPRPHGAIKLRDAVDVEGVEERSKRWDRLKTVRSNVG